MKRLHMVLFLVLTHIHSEVLRAYSGSTQKSPLARPYAVPELKLTVHTKAYYSLYCLSTVLVVDSSIDVIVYASQC